MLFSNIDIVFHHSKELTVQCTQTGENNVCFRECRFAGLCEREFSFQNQTLSLAKCFASFFKSKFVDEKL